MDQVTKNNQEKITKRDITISWIRWHAYAEVSANFERLQALAFCASITGILEKLYKKKEDLSRALKKHLTMFNTQANWGSVINGITIALEEKASQETENKEESEELITGIKTGLMGPIAGIGDSLDFGTIRPILMGISIPFALKGSVFAAFVPLVGQILYMAIVGLFMIHKGYSTGKESITSLLSSGKIQQIISGAGVLGMFMMGALSATFISLSTPLVISTEGANPIEIQSMLDGIVPNLLPFAVVFAIYLYLKKTGANYLKVVGIVLAVSLLGAAIGLF